MAATQAPQAPIESDVIPILDLAPIDPGRSDGPSGAELDRLASELGAALTDIGFFFVVNHGVPWTRVEQVYDMARRLHRIDVDELSAIVMDAEHGGYLEYAGGTSYASEIAGDVRTPNLNAAFFVHRGGYRLANRWPELEGFRAVVDRYIDEVTALAHRLLPLLARSLDLDDHHFDPHFDVPSSTLRLSHYPVVDYGRHDWGLAPHTDSTIMTLLPANDVPGLEIRPAGHDWMAPPSLPRSFLINSGDMLKRWTNHRYRSTAHRARNASDTDRYAIPFFFGARDDAVIEALPTCVGPDRPAKHDPITYGDYQRWFLNRNYEGLTGRRASEEAP